MSKRSKIGKELYAVRNVRLGLCDGLVLGWNFNLPLNTLAEVQGFRGRLKSEADQKELKKSKNGKGKPSTTI
jgi:hypothetical protein